MSDEKGYGGTIAAVGGVGFLYWVAVFVVHATIIYALFLVFAAVMAGVVIYWIVKYLAMAGVNASIGDYKKTLQLLAPLVFAPLGLALGLYFTEVAGMTPLSTSLDEMGVGVLLLPYGSWMFFGWIFIGMFTYEHDYLIFSTLLWFIWGLSWSLCLGAEGFEYLSNVPLTQ